MAETEARTISSLRENETEWFHHYRCFQVVLTATNDAIGDMFMPLQSMAMMSLGILSLYCLIKLIAIETLVTLIYIIILLCIYFYFRVLIHGGSELLTLSKSLVAYRKRRSRSKYAVIMIKSCAPLSPKLGPFDVMNESTVVSMVGFIVDSTLNLLLM